VANTEATWAGTIVGFTANLTLLFIGMRLMGYTGWSWIWVLSPLWCLVAAFLVLALVANQIAKRAEYQVITQDQLQAMMAESN
jgi:hypothetical protein